MAFIYELFISGVFLLKEKDLKKLNRYQLLELLLIQTERADSLQSRVEELEKQLQNQEIKISSLGSIAEASLQIQGVFEAAQKAADMYIEAAKKRAAEIEEEALKNNQDEVARAMMDAYGIKGEENI